LKKHCKIKRLLRKQQILWNSLTITRGDGNIAFPQKFGGHHNVNVEFGDGSENPA